MSTVEPTATGEGEEQPHHFLTRDDILNISDAEVQEVHVPEWGEHSCVRLRSLTGAERDRFEASIVDTKGKATRIRLEDMRAKLLVLVMVNAEGKRLFRNREYNLLGQRNAKVLDRLFGIAQEMNGLKAEDLVSAEKNLSDDQSDDFISD